MAVGERTRHHLTARAVLTVIHSHCTSLPLCFRRELVYGFPKYVWVPTFMDDDLRQQAHPARRSQLLTRKGLCRIAQLTWLPEESSTRWTIHPVTVVPTQGVCHHRRRRVEQNPGKPAIEGGRSRVTSRRTVGRLQQIPSQS